MKIEKLREELIHGATSGSDVIAAAVPAYAAIQPRILAVATTIVDMFVSQVGDYEVTEEQAHGLSSLVAQVTGAFSGMLTSLELTQEDIDATAVAAMSHARKIMGQELAKRINEQVLKQMTDAPGTVSNPHDIN